MSNTYIHLYIYTCICINLNQFCPRDYVISQTMLLISHIRIFFKVIFSSYALLAPLKGIDNFFVRQGVKQDYLMYSGLFFSFVEK